MLGGTPQLTQILLFRRNLERVAQDEEELREEIRTTLLHETGHFFGMTEKDLDDVGWAGMAKGGVTHVALSAREIYK